MFKLNNIEYTITSQDISIKPKDDGIQTITINVIGKNEIIDSDIGEVSISLETDIFEDSNIVVHDVIADVFCAEFTTATGTFEATDTTYHFYGIGDINWNEELGKDVIIELEIERRK